jgi:hypothetical protein
MGNETLSLSWTSALRVNSGTAASFWDSLESLCEIPTEAEKARLVRRPPILADLVDVPLANSAPVGHPRFGMGLFSWNRRFWSVTQLGEISSMRTFGSKVLFAVVAALVGAVVLHSLVYLSVDPGSLSAQMPGQYRTR